jgi:hypothetical protein
MTYNGKLTWNCGFNLQYFPFGKQVCNFCMGQAMTEKYVIVQFSPREGNVTGTKASIDLIGKTLGEYLFINAFDRATENNQSVMFTLRFQSDFGYYMLNGYVPSLLIFLLAYSTFFFPLDNFNERVMVSLTSLLVLTTFFDQINASVVHTSYVKLIDVWFAALIMANFIVIISNVIINDMVRRNTKPKITTVTPQGHFVKSSSTFADESSNLAERINIWMIVLMLIVLMVFLTTYIAIASRETF